MDRSLLAKEYFLKGYSCSMAVILAFEDYIKMDINDFLRIASPFGGGVSRLRELCGVYSASIMILGYLFGFSTNDSKKKNDLYNLIQEFTSFYKKSLSIYCFELLHIKREAENPKPEERNTQYYQKRPCPEIVRIGAKVLETFISNKI